MPVFGGGVALHVTPRLLLDADVHGGRWFGEGLDWVTGARAAIGYRF